MSYITHCHDIDYYVYPMIPYSEQKIISAHTKNVGILLLVPTSQGLRITHHCKIEQREAHAVLLLIIINVHQRRHSPLLFL